MKKTFQGMAGFVVVALAFVSVTTGVAAASQSIRPHQHFRGLVNGATADAVVFTSCAGPVSPGRTGPVVAGELSVVRARRGTGDTGLFSQIYAWFVPTTATAPTQLTFTSYRSPQAVPESVQVPCEGAGQVEFSSCPYLAPCAAGWVPEYVDVTFVNIAV